jgi:hypothetical protein
VGAGHAGAGEEGIAQLHQGLAAFRAAAGDLDRPRYLAHLAEAYGQVGQTTVMFAIPSAPLYALIQSSSSVRM